MINNELNNLPYKEFLTKEEVCDILGISNFTLNNWIRDYKPDNKEKKTGKQNKGMYAKSYIIRILNTLNRDDLISLIESNKKLIKNTAHTNNITNTNQITSYVTELEVKLEAQERLITSQQRHINLLEKQIDQKDEQLRQQQKITENQQTLSLQQNRLLLENKETKKKSGGVFGWFGSKD